MEGESVVSVESVPNKALVMFKPEQLCGELWTGRWGRKSLDLARTAKWGTGSL